jgi:hypothetical protein
MMSAIIFVCCLGAVGQFSVAYCRSILAVSDTMAISDYTRQVAGLHGKALDPSEFDRLLGLARMVGIPASDTNQLRAVKTYYRVLSFAERLLPSRSPQMLQWIEHELSRCTYFAAVSLDRRLAPVAN